MLGWRHLFRRLRLEHPRRPGSLAGLVIGVLATAVAALGVIPVTHYVREGLSPVQAVRSTAEHWGRAWFLVDVPIPAAGSGRYAAVPQWRVWRGDPSPADLARTPVFEPDGTMVLAAGPNWLLTDEGRPVRISGVREVLELEGPPDEFELWITFARVPSLPPIGLRPGPHPVPVDSLASLAVPVRGERMIVPATLVASARAATTATQRFAGPRQLIGRGVGVALDVLASFWWPVIPAALGGGLAFAILPEVRRRARVRAVHLLRVGAYAGVMLVGWAIVVGLIGAGIGGSTARLDLTAIASATGLMRIATWLGLSPDDGRLLLDVIRWILVPAVIAGVWWSLAARHHLRLARPRGVGWSVAGVAALSGTVCMQLWRGIF
jgi:hypothetical protein